MCRDTNSKTPFRAGSAPIINGWYGMWRARLSRLAELEEQRAAACDDLASTATSTALSLLAETDTNDIPQAAQQPQETIADLPEEWAKMLEFIRAHARPTGFAKSRRLLSDDPPEPTDYDFQYEDFDS